MTEHYSLQEIVSRLGGELVGAADTRISNVASLTNARHGHISFMADPKYRALLASTQASAIILSHSERGSTTLPCIVTENPYAYFAKVSELLNPRDVPHPRIDEAAKIGEDCNIPDTCSIAAYAVIGNNVVFGQNVVIGPNCVIGDHVHIGDNTHLQANVVVYHDCVIGRSCNLFAGSVIGADGFGYAEENGRWIKIPQVGRVLIEDNVDVGANTTIDRGALDDTLIEEGVKLDNLIQIGHNCRIGAHTVIAGCVGIAGSAHIGRHCKIGGAAMVLGHLEIADGVTISPGSMITRSLSQPDTYTALMPFQSHTEWLRTAANIRRLGDMAVRVKQLEKEIAIFAAQQNKTDNN